MTHPIFACKKDGLTLIETIIYVALFGFILTGVVVSIYPIFSGADKTSRDVSREIESLFVLQKISWTISSASSVSVAESNNELNVTTPDGNFIFRENNRAIEIKNAGGGFEPLNSSRVRITDFKVNDYAVSEGAPRYIEIEFLADGLKIGPIRKNLYF
jgi:hypothetical protein